MAKDDEPIVLYWIGQATNPRLKARYWLQVALFNIIIYAVLIVSSPGLIFFIPALIVAIKAVKKLDEGNEERCKRLTLYSMILNYLGITLGGISLLIFLLIPSLMVLL
jgi:4-hydroxybenzoate polyprenyltransferase